MILHPTHGKVVEPPTPGCEGRSARARARVEAYVGDTKCGAFSLPPVKMVFDDTQGYSIDVASPDVVPGCAKGGSISFRINGNDTGITTVNDLVQRQDHPLDLREK